MKIKKEDYEVANILLQNNYQKYSKLKEFENFLEKLIGYKEDILLEFWTSVKFRVRDCEDTRLAKRGVHLTGIYIFLIIVKWR